ncbi:hypothetical protein FDZ63_04430 [Ehrlichia ruminantium]|uniref:hypothetical protein n=1 Tax=Ehrlichia ruminantium TaxID=779 RepID=UPI00080B2F82|nr:hypothetical protein [Ehrlichia ruminantium]QLK54554.1 hypothetical protein FDZ63_04430 [Ehrlichia ruminantium]
MLLFKTLSTIKNSILVGGIRFFIVSSLHVNLRFVTYQLQYFNMLLFKMLSTIKKFYSCLDDIRFFMLSSLLVVFYE